MKKKKKEKKKEEEEITTSLSILLLTMIVWDHDTNFLDQNQIAILIYFRYLI